MPDAAQEAPAHAHGGADLLATKLLRRQPLRRRPAHQSRMLAMPDVIAIPGRLQGLTASVPGEARARETALRAESARVLLLEGANDWRQ